MITTVHNGTVKAIFEQWLTDGNSPLTERIPVIVLKSYPIAQTSHSRRNRVTTELYPKDLSHENKEPKLERNTRRLCPRRKRNAHQRPAHQLEQGR
jgi:hypothetical protein